MPTRRSKGYTSAFRDKRENPDFNGPVLLIGRVAVAHGLYCKVDKELEKRKWNWSELARRTGYSPAHIRNACKGPTLNMGVFLQIMQVLELQWQNYCSLEYPTPSGRQTA